MSGRIHKLFVSNLAWTVGNNELKNYFRNFGRIFSGGLKKLLKSFKLIKWYFS
jgi:RNA recognition motif-containing protein